MNKFKWSRKGLAGKDGASAPLLPRNYDVRRVAGHRLFGWQVAVLAKIKKGGLVCAYPVAESFVCGNGATSGGLANFIRPSCNPNCELLQSAEEGPTVVTRKVVNGSAKNPVYLTLSYPDCGIEVSNKMAPPFTLPCGRCQPRATLSTRFIHPPIFQTKGAPQVDGVRGLGCSDECGSFIVDRSFEEVSKVITTAKEAYNKLPGSRR